MDSTAKFEAHDGVRALSGLVPSDALPSPFHSPEWLEAAAKGSGTRLKLLTLLEPGVASTILPVFFGNTPVSEEISSPPRGLGIPYMGPIIRPVDAIRQYRMENHLKRFVEGLMSSQEKGRLVRGIRIVAHPSVTDVRPFLWRGFRAQVHYTYELDAKRPGDEMLNNFPSKMRKGIRKLSRDGWESKLGQEDDLEALFRSVRARYREQGLKEPLPVPFTREIISSQFGRSLLVLKLLKGGEEGPSIALVYDRSRVFLWQGPLAMEGGHTSLSDLLIWEAIKWAKASGHSFFDLVGASTERLSQFKSKFNPTAVPYFDLRWTNRWGRVAETVYSATR